jgi:hypothetical protein
MSKHEHTFEPYIGLPIKRVRARRIVETMAWVPKRKVYVSPADPTKLPEMLRCACGEQGYEIPADA